MIIKSVDSYTTVANQLVDNTVPNAVILPPSYHQSPQTINPQHLNEWTEGSGIDPELALLNLQSLSGDDAIEAILYSPKITRRADGRVTDHYLNRYQHLTQGGWYCAGLNPLTGENSPWGCFKPDHPYTDPKKNKLVKYEHPPQVSTGTFFLRVTEAVWRKVATRYNLLMPDNLIVLETEHALGFWAWVLENPTIPVAIVEGAKKAAALLSFGYAAIAIPGIRNAYRAKPTRHLHPDLKLFCQPGRHFIFVYDQDAKSQTIADVKDAIVKTAELILQEGCSASVATWDLLLGKGIDDVLANHGPEQVNKIMNTAIPYKQWLQGLERQFKPQSTQKKRITPADLIARDIAEEYRSSLAFNNQSGLWMRYEADSPGVWSSESPEFIESLIYQVLTSKNIEGYGGNTYIANIVKILRHQLLIRKWKERSPSELIPFQNGVLELATGKLLPHNPGYRFTWSMPREHNILAKDWSLIDQFFNTVSKGNPQVKKLLLCFCNAVLKGRSDLQKFLHLIGPGGSGKGTFTRLLTDLIGQSNTHTSNLEEWCGNRFEAANAYQKRLVIFPDEDKKVGNLGRFKSLMGQDLLRAEEKGRKAFQYQFGGMVILSSNFPIFQGDNSSGMTRRTILVSFNHVPAPSDRRDLNRAC
ncbi:MAG: DUF3854 domain-containing protein [Snowella sp.]|nr:DUF3854 domain-containing protein [Snowella sp.]